MNKLMPITEEEMIFRIIEEFKMSFVAI